MKNLYYRLRILGVAFWLLWVGQTIAMFGTQLLQFAMSVWIYQQTGSVLSFAGVLVASILPAVLVMPIAGSVVDRVDRRYVMIVCDCLVAIMTACALVLLLNGALRVPHLYLLTGIGAVITSFQGPAYQASIRQLVGQESLGRAAGAMSVSSTCLGIVAPSVAGSLLVSVGLTGLVALDLVAFIVGTLFVWRAFMTALGSGRVARGTITEAIRSSLSNFASALAFFQRNPKMLSLLFYSLVQAAMLALAVSLVVPLILAHHSSASLGVVLSFGAAGALAGSLAMMLLDLPWRRMLVILVCDAILAWCMLLAGVSTSITAFCSLQFCGGVATSVAASCGYSLWMTKVPERQQGSILVVLASCSMLTTVAIVIFGGIVVDRVFEPALAAGGSLAGSIGEWLGTGKGRGMGLMFVITGMLGLVTTIVGLAVRPLREFS